jgi:hypothetical protein
LEIRILRRTAQPETKKNIWRGKRLDFSGWQPPAELKSGYAFGSGFFSMELPISLWVYGDPAE